MAPKANLRHLSVFPSLFSPVAFGESLLHSFVSSFLRTESTFLIKVEKELKICSHLIILTTFLLKSFQLSGGARGWAVKAFLSSGGPGGEG